PPEATAPRPPSRRTAAGTPRRSAETVSAPGGLSRRGNGFAPVQVVLGQRRLRLGPGAEGQGLPPVRAGRRGSRRGRGRAHGRGAGTVRGLPAEIGRGGAVVLLRAPGECGRRRRVLFGSPVGGRDVRRQRLPHPLAA